MSRASSGAGAVGVKSGAGGDGNSAMAVDGVEVLDESAGARVLTLPEAANGAGANGSGRASAAWEAQLACAGRRERAAFDASSEREDAAGSDDEGVALSVIKQGAERVVEAGALAVPSGAVGGPAA